MNRYMMHPSWEADSVPWVALAPETEAKGRGLVRGIRKVHSHNLNENGVCYVLLPTSFTEIQITGRSQSGRN